MKDINVSSDQISKIVGVLDEIAFQTSILALSAAVGLADSASSCAHRGAQATKDTAALVAQSIAGFAPGFGDAHGGDRIRRAVEPMEATQPHEGATTKLNSTIQPELATEAQMLYRIVDGARTLAGGDGRAPSRRYPAAFADSPRNSEGIAALRTALAGVPHTAPPPAAKHPPTQELYPLDTNESTQ